MKTLLSAILVLMTQVSYAQYDLGGRWGLGLGAGVNPVVGDKDIKDSYLKAKMTAGVWVRYHLDKNWGLELAYTHQEFKWKYDQFSGKPASNILDLSVAYRFVLADAHHLLLQAGLGNSNVSNYVNDASGNNVSVNRFQWMARLGYEYMLNPDWMIAFHADYRNVKLKNGFGMLNTLSPNLAITYYFGAAAAAAPAVVAAEAVAAAPKVADADGDGIADENDKCPGTPAGQAVNEFGCAKTEKLEFTLNVKFAAGSTKLDPKSTEDLDKFADFLTEHAAVTAEIEGHTDNTGKEKQNFSISQKRANAVMNYLVKNKKIDKKRLTAKGYGPSQPIADNGTAEGRAQNRRVVAHVKTEK